MKNEIIINRSAGLQSCLFTNNRAVYEVGDSGFSARKSDARQCIARLEGQAESFSVLATHGQTDFLDESRTFTKAKLAFSVPSLPSCWVEMISEVSLMLSLNKAMPDLKALECGI